MAGDQELASAARRMTVVQLKAQLQERGLSTSGKKDDLLHRLLEHLENGAEEAPNGDDGPSGDEANEGAEEPGPANVGDDAHRGGETPKKRKRGSEEGNHSGSESEPDARKRTSRSENEDEIGAEEPVGQGSGPADAGHESGDVSGDDVGPSFELMGAGGGAAADEDDMDIGPVPGPAAAQENARRKQRTLRFEKLYLDHLPDAEMYERSLMHRDVVNFVQVSKTDFIITTSIDGHVKFWKKTERGIEFVKHYRAHLGAVIALDVSFDGTLLATVGVDKFLKVFDVVNFDMINMIKLDFAPRTACWTYERAQARPTIAISDRESSAIHIFDARAESDSGPLHTVTTVHSQPVCVMRYNPVARVVVSVDDGGNVEYWLPREEMEFAPPKPPVVSWEFKADTDLYEFRKSKTVPTSLNFSPDYSHFVTTGFGDRQIRIFNFATAKMTRKYDESLQSISEMQQAGTAYYTLDDMEFGRRFALEREIEKNPTMGQAATMNAVFDETGNFVLYPTLLGIKVVNIRTNKVARIIGKGETIRFMNICLYQGAPVDKKLVTLEMAASENPLFKDSGNTDPTVFCTAYKRNRFYLFSRREPESADDAPGGSGRDIFNEKPSREDQVVAQFAAQTAKQSLGSSAILRTTVGDIHIRLFPEFAPKAVENFVGLAKKGYYDNLTFHRVIKNFMIQTGCPFGDGTGGESVWGNDFEDEFNKAVKHDRPYTVSMANAGPNTNASQFFITVVPTPWLDNKHTIFGRATAGFDVIHKIEGVKVDRHEKPLEAIRIMGIEVR
ncbi:hypothetical protein DFJ74DRAFT_685365 [Hyaloraphidium curvatum]|nr:hypothetical protein DFJ74DRAFT_685365 [Hyaloraphidium curvatum]